MFWIDWNYLFKTVFILIFFKPLQCWLFKDASSAKTAVALDAKGEAGRFELKTSDDKFLAQAQTYLQLSPLDQVGSCPRFHTMSTAEFVSATELQ